MARRQPARTHDFVNFRYIPGADTFFPEIDMGIWQETSRVRHPADADNAYDFDFVIYKRVS